MAIKGSLRRRASPTCCSCSRWGRRRGCLSVTHRQSFGYIYFDQGRICYASIVNRRDRLGDILVKNGADHAGAARRRRSPCRTRSGTRASARSSSSASSSRARSSTATSACRSKRRSTTCSPGTRGRSTSRPDVAPDEQDFLVSINPESLLLEGARRVDEWSLIEKKIPSFDLVFEVDRDRLADSATSTLDDGAGDARCRSSTASATCTALVDESGLGEFDVGQGALRPDHRRLPAPRRPHEAGGDRDVGGARRRTSQPRRRVLQDGDARRGACASSAA